MPFLVFEGLDGSGKSTLIAGLTAHLKSLGIEHLVTREPGGSALGEEIRRLLLRVGHEAPVPRAELLLYEAARVQHVELVIQPALAAGQWVLCDRFSASSIAFQCGGRGLDEEEVRRLNRFATHDLQPDLWVLLDLTVAESQRRREGRERRSGQEADRFEREEAEFHERVRRSYLDQARQDAGRWLVMSAATQPDRLLADLLRQLKERGWLNS